MTVTDALGWTLLHFLWQGALIALALSIADSVLRNATARARYAAACGALALMLASAAGTFAWLYPGLAPANFGSAAAPAAVPPPPAPLSALWETPATPPAAGFDGFAGFNGFSGYLPVLVYFWFAGVCALGVRSFGGWVMVQRLARQASRPADEVWQQRLAKLAGRLQITRALRLRESALAEVPAVIGWLRPVVLLPGSAMTGLSPQQLEALLAHELAHIRRHDYLVNLVQTAVETLLFYHPAVWWVGKRIRAERENCCDDLAVEVCGDALVYARALARLEQLRGRMPQLAMASNRGSLLERIRRLIGTQPVERVTGSGWQEAWHGAVPTLLLLAAVLVAPYVVVNSGLSQETAPASVTADSSYPPQPAPAPARSASAPAQPPLAPAPPAQLAPTPQTAPAPPEPAASPESAASPEPVAGPEPVAAPAAPAILAAPAVAPAPVHVGPVHPTVQVAVPGGVIGGTVGGVIGGVADGVIAGTIDGVLAGVSDGLIAGIHGGIVTGVSSGVTAKVRNGVEAEVSSRVAAEVSSQVAARVSDRIRRGVFPATVAMQATPAATGQAPAGQASAAPGNTQARGFIDGLAAAGFNDLTVDQLIKLKTHGVTPEYVREIQAAGFKPTAEELIKLRIHGVTGEYIGQLKAAGVDTSLDNVVKFRIHGVNLAAVKEMTALGYKLSADDMVKMRIHGLTPELAREAKQLGLGDPSFDQLVKMQIHGVNQEFIGGMKGVGLRDLNFDQLVKLRIHGADPAQIRAFTELGYKDLTADTVVKMRVHGVTPEFIREVQRHGFKDLTLDKIIKLKQLGIVDEPAFI